MSRAFTSIVELRVASRRRGDRVVIFCQLVLQYWVSSTTKPQMAYTRDLFGIERFKEHSLRKWRTGYPCTTKRNVFTYDDSADHRFLSHPFFRFRFFFCYFKANKEYADAHIQKREPLIERCSLEQQREEKKKHTVDSHGGAVIPTVQSTGNTGKTHWPVNYFWQKEKKKGQTLARKHRRRPLVYLTKCPDCQSSTDYEGPAIKTDIALALSTYL